MIKQKKNHRGGGLIPLLFKLYQIKKEHKTLTKFRKTLELARSDLALPPLQNCPDFNEAIWIKSQLSYRLGQVLIECDKAKFKGAYLSFFKKVEKCKKEFHAFRKSKAYLFRTKLKFQSEKDFDALLKHYLKLDELLIIAKFYTPLLHTLTLNLDFVMKNLEIITAWLKSETFKDKYEKTKHPYPPLLNPDILNELLECGCDMEALKSKEVSSEEFKEALEKVSLNKLSSEAKLYIKSGLDYRLIPASLAWDLNLSLPRNYKFLFWGSHGVGNFGFSNFMRKLKLNNVYYMNYSDSRLDYLNCYHSLLDNPTNYISIRNFTSINKFFFLLPSSHSVYLVRDVISSLKHHINFNWLGSNYLNIIDFGMDCKEIWENRIGYIPNPKTTQTPDVSSTKRLLTKRTRTVTFHDYTLMKVLNLKSIYIIDMSEIINGKAFETIDKLSKHFNLNRPALKDKIFYDTIFGEFNTFLPLNIEINQLLQLNQSVIISIWCKQLGSLNADLVSIDDLIQFSHSRFSVFTHKNNMEILQNNTKIYEKLKLYVDDLITALKRQKDIEDKKKIKEEHVLNFLQQNPKIAKKFKKILDKEHLTFIKKSRPDIVATWKYYLKFESICEELEKDTGAKSSF